MSDAWLLFLGTSSGTPTKGAWLPSILLYYQGVYVLLDCGEGTQIRLIENSIGPARIDLIAVTHAHGDHIFGLPGLLQSMGMSSRTKSLLIKGSEDVRYFIEASFKATRYEPPFEILFESPLVKTVVQEKPHITIQGFKTCHGEIESYGYVIEAFKKTREGMKRRFKIAYTGDTAPCRDYIEYLKGADVLIHDATFEEGMEKEAREYGHSTAKDAALVAREAEAKMLVLFHKSTRYKGKPGLLERQARRIFPCTYEAHDGMRLLI